MDISKFDSYSIDNVLVVSAASWGTIMVITILYFWFYLIEVHYPLVPATNSDLLVSALWGLVAVVVAALIGMMLRNRIRYFPPSWSFISIGSSFVFIFTIWVYGYWAAVSSYSPNSPFAKEPPTFWAVSISALLISIKLSIALLCVSFLAYVAWLHRERDADLRIEI